MATQKLQFDDGLLHLDINGNGLLTFNPSDFNVYERFFQLARELPAIEKKYVSEIEEASTGDDPDDTKIFELAGRELERAKEIDADIKRRLGDVFGPGNDFDALLGGVNVMALGSNGERVITNLLNALAPYIENGVNNHVESAASAAKANRAQRRAMQRKGSKGKVTKL